MNPKVLVCSALFAAGVCGAASISAWADDSAASIAAGGLVPRRETRIVMAKEVLRISPDKVVVDYDFRNDSGQDVTTEVAFPIPPYEYDFDGPEISSASFSDFQLLVDGKPITFQKEAKATLNGKDVTGILTSDGIDIATFGHLRETDEPEVELHTPDVERLPKPEQQRLVQMGLFGTDRPWGTWTVHLQYHWAQTFPAHATVHIRHEYTPVEGFTQVTSTSADDLLAHITAGTSIPKEDSDGVKLLTDFCADRPFLDTVSRRLHESESAAKTDDERLGAGISYPHWVDFILTSANTWKQPIEDFTLIVERGRRLDGYGKPMEGRRHLISFCSPQNTPVEKLDTDRFQVHLTNFVPTSELHIGFFDLPEAKPPPASSSKAR